MNRPAISIIIPVYNVTQYLPACLESIQEQTIDDLEILCVNDASPDKSNDILKRYAQKDHRITILHHSKNLGLAAARNSGIAAARGDYIFFLDSDDTLFSRNSLSRLYSIAKQDAADEVIGATLRWNEETGEREYGYHKAYLKKALNGILFESAPFLAGNVIGCNKLFRTSFLKKHNLQFSPYLKKFEDNPFSWKAHLLARSISVCTHATYLHRLRDSSGPRSIMQIKKRDYLYHAKAADDMLEFLEKNQDFNRVRHIIDRYFILWLQQDIMEVKEDQLDKEGKNEMLEIYQQVLSRIPKSSTQHFSSIQSSLFQLMQDKQYEIVWKKIRTLNQQTGESHQTRRLQNQLDAVYNSTSWRMTAPFRFVTKQIKRFL